MLRRAAAIAVAAIATAAVAEADIKPWTGKATPRLSGKDLHGNAIELQDYRGRVVVINFWATWCAPCKDELPSLQRLRSAMRDKPLEVLTVNYGEFPAKIEPFVAKEQLTLPVMLDTQKDTAKDWDVGGLPMTYVVDAMGRVRYRVFGECDWSQGEPLRLVENLLAEGARAGR